MYTPIGKPAADEYPEWFKEELDLVDYTDLVSELKSSFEPARQFLMGLSQEVLSYQYQPGKWTIPEMWQHVVDTERVLSYRVMRYARGDETVLHGFDQNKYVTESQAIRRPLTDILREHAAVRNATIELLLSFQDPGIVMRRGTAGKSQLTVRAVGGLIYAHQTHHLQLIRQKYLI